MNEHIKFAEKKGDSTISGSDLKAKTIGGFLWNSITIFIRDGSLFVTQLILASLLLPEHFGLIGMAIVFIGVFKAISELGLSAALIQRRASELNEDHFYTAFWVTTVFAIVVLLSVAGIIGPLVAGFYSEPLLSSLLVVLTIPVLFNVIIIPHRVALVRELNFKTIAMIEGLASVSGSVAGITFALMGGGVWSIAIIPVIYSLVATPLFWLKVRWRPRFVFSMKAFRDIFSFGMYVLANDTVSHFARYVDFLIIGRVLDSMSLGLYSLAHILTDTFRAKTMEILNKVMFPVYSIIQDDLEKTRNHFLKIIQFNSIVIFPVMLLLFLYADHIIMLFFGDRWIESVSLLQLLSIAAALHASVGTSSVLFKGIGKPKLDFQIFFLTTVVIKIPAVILGIYYLGLTGAATGIIISKFLAIVVRIYFLKKLIDITPRQIAVYLKPAVLSCIGIIVIYALITSTDIEITVSILTAIFISSVIIYGALIYFSGPKKEIVDIAKAFYFQITNMESKR